MYCKLVTTRRKYSACTRMIKLNNLKNRQLVQRFLHLHLTVTNYHCLNSLQRWRVNRIHISILDVYLDSYLLTNVFLIVHSWMARNRDRNARKEFKFFYEIKCKKYKSSTAIQDRGERKNSYDRSRLLFLFARWTRKSRSSR